MANKRVKKLSEHQIGEIFECRNRGMKQEEIAAQFGVSQKNISNILLRRVWKAEGGPFPLAFSGPVRPRGEEHWKSALSEKDVRKMRRLHQDGISICELSRRYGMARSSVGYAISGKSWAHVV